MNQDIAKPDLSQLRDIHLPEPISWWPPALGWWLLLAIVVLAMVVGWQLYRRHRRNAWRRGALAELARLRLQYQSQQSAPQPVVSELSVLLRRVAISRFPREEAAKLSGEPWLEFLDRGNAVGARFQSETGRLLVVAPYSPQMDIAPDEMNQLFALCERWIANLKRHKGKAAQLTVRGELVEPPAPQPEPFDKLRANGNILQRTSSLDT